MATGSRPISPHLQIYRWYFTMALSILHRVTGVALAGFLVFVTWWLMALASGPEAYARFAWWIDSWLGGLVLVLVTIAMFYHLLNGVRHLAWDMGWGYDPQVARQTGVWVLAGTAVLTLLTWIVILSAG